MPKRLTLLLLLLGVSACAGNQTKYNWGNYSSALVAMDADPSTAGAYEAELAKIINSPDGKVPPGIYAEYGYMLQSQGNTADALGMYQREKAAWPESAFFMNKMISSLQPQTAAQPKPAS